MALVAVGLAAIALLGGYTVTRMLKDPEDTRYRDPREMYVSRTALVFLVVPVVLLVSGHWQGAIAVTVFIPVMLWLAKMNRDYQRERLRKRR